MRNGLTKSTERNQQWRSDAMTDLLDPTQCSYCKTTLVDPRILPCLHTFCLECLRSVLAECKFGNRFIKCPSCLELVAIPPDGVAALRKNYIMDVRIERRRLSRHVSSIDGADNVVPLVCTNDGCPDRNSKIASVYCTVCRKGLCDYCRGEHGIKTRGSHVIRNIRNGRLEPTDLTRLIVRYCQQHDGGLLNVYCNDCRLLVCQACFIERHNGHKHASLDQSVESLRCQLSKEIDISRAVCDCERQQAEHLRLERKRVTDDANRLQMQILQRSDELKKRIDEESEQLLKLLSKYKLDEQSKLEDFKEDIEARLNIRRRFTQYLIDIRDEGTPIALAQSAKDVDSLAKELGREKSRRTVHTSSVSLGPVATKSTNIIGALKFSKKVNKL